MNLAITGGRDYKLQPEDWLFLGQELGTLSRDGVKMQDVIIHHGAARGVDTEVSQKLANDYGFLVAGHPAEWERLGKAAGPLRNQKMALIAELLLAFPGGRGTQHMVDTCRGLGVTVHESPTRAKA